MSHSPSNPTLGVGEATPRWQKVFSPLIVALFSVSAFAQTPRDDALAPHESAADFLQAHWELPNWPEIAARVSWTLATHDDPRRREPAAALVLARRACQATNHTQPRCLDALAAALASDGKYSQAADTAGRALRLAHETGDVTLRDQIAGRLRQYESGQPHSEPSANSPAWPPAAHAPADAAFSPRFRQACQYHVMATELFDADLVEQAKEAWRRAIASEPRFYPARLSLGHALAQQGSFAEAAHHFEHVAAGADDPDALLALALTYESLGRADRAIESLRAALRLKPQWIEPANNLAMILATHADPQIRDPEEALKLATSICNVAECRQPRLLDTLAHACAAVGRFDEAASALSKSLKLDPAPREAKNAARRSSEVRLALYRERIPYTNHRAALISLGHTAMHRDDVTRAANYFSEALTTDAADAETILALGIARQQQNRPLEALNLYARASLLRPQWPQAVNNMAWLMATAADARVRRPADSVKLAEPLCESQPREPLYLDTLAAAYAACQRFEDAIVAIDRALSLLEDNAPDDPRRASLRDRRELYYDGLAFRGAGAMYAHLGHKSLQAGEVARAAERFRRALETSAEDPDVRLALGLAFEHHGDITAALDHYEAALRLKPDSLAALNNIAWLRATTDDARVRDPRRAVELAKRLCGATEQPEPRFLDTLAAAYAAAGDFSAAADSARSGVSLLNPLDDASRRFAAKFRERLKHYELGQLPRFSGSETSLRPRPTGG